MGMTLEPKDKMRAARVINDWRNHERPFEDTPYWSKRFAIVEEVFEKTRPASPVVLWRNERTDIDNQYDKRFTSWSRRPELVEGFGWGKRRMVWVYVKPSAVMVNVAAFGPKIDKDQMQEVILRPGQYHIEEYPKNSWARHDVKRPPLSESWDSKERTHRIKKRVNQNFTILCNIIKEALLFEQISLHEDVIDDREFSVVGSLQTGAGSATVVRDRNVTAEDTASRVLRMLSSLPKRELSKSAAKRIEVYDNPEDVTMRLEEVGIFDSGMSNGVYDFETGTLYACVWDGHAESPRTTLHEFGHSIVGQNEDAAEAWFRNYEKAVVW